MAKFADTLITPALTLLGLVLMATPLALWVAWTEAILLIVLATGITAGVLYCVLVRFEKSAGPNRSTASRIPQTRALPDKVIAELQELHPFVHHHRPTSGPKFQKAMSLLKKRLYRGPD